MKKPEQILTTRVANYMKTKYPNVVYRFDIGADVPLPMVHAKRNKELHGKFSRGHPDMTIYSTKGAIFIELKATKRVVNTEHTRRQSKYHDILRNAGYKVSFCCGYKECIGYIDENI